MSTTHDRDNTATPDVRENPSHMPDRNRVFSPAPPLIPLTHGSGLKKLAAAAFLAGGLGLAIIGPGGGVASADPTAPNVPGLPGPGSPTPPSPCDGDKCEQDSLRTQQDMDQKSQFEETWSNLMKAESDTSKSITENMK